MRRFRVSRRLLVAAGVLCIGSTSALGAVPERDLTEAIDAPAGIRAGIDVIYVDPDVAPRDGRAGSLLHRASVADFAGPEAGVVEPRSRFYDELRRGLKQYRETWGGLPRLQIPTGPALRPGQSGERVSLLRQRLGLAAADSFDAKLAEAVLHYKHSHGLADTPVVDAATIESLNLGAEHYERLIQLNLERARALPAGSGRFIMVDAAAARLWLYQDGLPVDSMKVIVGSSAHATPMLAGMLRYADVNPYWNVPQDLVRRLVASRVLSQGVGYLSSRRYEVLSDWTPQASPLDPTKVDWQAVVDGKQVLRVRQLPGANNSMGRIKFMMPNEYGIYLHDTPNKDLFAQEDRWISNGCIRVEDAQRLATWLFGAMPQAGAADVQTRVPLQQPVPVYVTYFTAVPGSDGVTFRADRYGRDRTALATMFPNNRIETAARQMLSR